MLAPCSMSCSNLQSNTELSSHWASDSYLTFPGVTNQQNLISWLKYRRWFINQPLYFYRPSLWHTRICSEGCRLERSLREKTTHIIFRKSAMCFGMKGYWTLSWQLLSGGPSIVVCVCVHICKALLNHSLILNHTVERSDEWTVTMRAGSG